MACKKTKITFRPAPITDSKLNQVMDAFGYDNKTDAIEFSIEYAANVLLGKRRKIKLKI